MATDITDATDLTDTDTTAASLSPTVEVDMYFAKTFNASILIIVGFYMAFLGYSRNLAGTRARTVMKRLHMFLVGYAFVSIIMVQIQYFGAELGNSTTLWIVFQTVLPLGGAVVLILFHNIGVLGIGIHVALLLANLLVPTYIPTWIEDVFPKTIIIQTIGFVGGILCLVLEMETYYLLLSFISTACGISFLLEGINCFADVVPAIRPFDYKDVSYVCNPSATTAVDKIIFFVVIFGGAILGLIVQAGFAVFFAKAFKRTPKRRPAPQVEKHAKHNRPQVSGEKPSLWHFIRHRGEYLSFRTHLKHLGKRLGELCLNQRETTSLGHYADDSQYVVLADQLTLLTSHEHQPSTIHHEAIKWLEDKQNWDLLLNQPDDLFEMKHLNRLEYTKLMHEDPWGDFITLQAIIQVYEIPVNVISSIWDPPLVEFPLIPQKRQQPAPIKQKQDKALKLGVKFIEESEIMDAVPEGVITLVGADGKAVRCFKAIVMKSSTISTFVQEAAEENMSVITFDEDPSLTGDVLFRICKRLEAMHVMEETAKMDDIPDAPLKYLDLENIFVPEERKAVKPMYVSHYWGYHYGSLEAAPKKDRPTVLPQSAPQMRTWTRPHTRMALNRVTHIAIILAGIWWILWMLIWGYRFDTFITGLQFILFWIAETVNFVLGIVYNMNFWQPIKRRWKSLDKLTPPFVKHIIVNCMIFHYSEDPKDTGRTLGGALRMKLTQGTTLRVWICDDGFWVYPKKAPVKQKSLLDKLAGAINSCRRKFKAQPQAQVEMADLEAKPAAPVATEIPKAKSDYKPTWPGEDEMVSFIRDKYGCVPKNEVKDMLAMIKQEVYRYYSEKLHCRVNVSCKIEIGTIDNGEVVRGDCAKASVHYHFFAEYYGRIAGPEVIIVGRVKPDKHHYKAGNINNAIYNSKMEGEFAILLDNDMKPTPDFILRTVPWFYYFNEETQNYHVNKAISFIQSPQFFKASTIAQGHDFLGGNNSVFFQGIQVGRDGFDLCAFAGTNAIFSLTAMRSVNGLPYGSLTEDANLAIFLHRFGFRSIYVEDRLAIGLAPVTVANSMQQRSRWVKGSVQILMNNLSCGPQHDEIKWEHESPYEVYTQKDIEPFGIPTEKKGKHNLFRIAYALDTMLYPFSAVTAMFYMIIAFLFLVVDEAPLNFTRPPFSYKAFLVTFLPFFLLKSISTYLSYNRVNSNDVWVAQEIWFSFSFAALWGIIDAFKESITGTGLGGWGVTGEGKRSSNMEWFNTIVLFVLAITIFIRFLIFLTDPGANITVIAAIFFSITIVIQMWPMVGTSLYEWVHNSHLPVDEKVDLHRYEVPNYIIFYFVLILGIFVSVFAIGNIAGVGTPN